MTIPIKLNTGDPLWVVIWIDEQGAIRFPADWWQALKLRWFPGWLQRSYPVIYTKEYRRWWLQGIYSDEKKACHACAGPTWCYFPFLLNVAYPESRVEVQTVFPVRDATRCNEISAPSLER